MNVCLLKLRKILTSVSQELLSRIKLKFKNLGKNGREKKSLGKNCREKKAGEKISDGKNGRLKKGRRKK